MWLGLVSALFYHYDDVLLGGQLFSFLMDHGIAIKVQLPHELFDDEPPPAPLSAFPNRPTLYIRLHAALWNYICDGDHLDLIQAEFEGQLARVVASLLCGMPEQHKHIARLLLGLEIDQDSRTMMMARLPNALVVHLANTFLSDKDAVNLASCDTRHFLQLRKTYQCRGIGGRIGPSPFVIGQVTHIRLDTPHERSIDLALFPRLSHVTVAKSFNDTILTDTIRSLSLDFWYRFPRGLVFSVASRVVRSLVLRRR